MSKIYILPGLAQAQSQALTAAGVEWFAWGLNTCAVPEGSLRQALGVLNMQVVEEATEYEDVVQLRSTGPAVTQPGAPAAPRQLTNEQKRSRENYIAACSTRAAEILKAAKEAVNQQRREFPGKVQRFVLDKRDVAFCATPLSEEVLAARFSSQFEELLQLPNVKDVRVTRQALLVYTDTLYATARDTGSRHELGRFLIVVEFDGKNSGIRWFNATRRVDAIRAGMNAPNVYEDGTAYQDAMLATFYELIARLQLASLVDMAIQYLEEVPNDETATLINKWPLAEEGA